MEAYFDPSVAQPPLPLQEFLPLQPLSPELHPPLPLQEFLPAQACFSTFDVLDFAFDFDFELESCLLESCAGAAARATVPPSNPVMAAVNTNELLETFMLL